MPVDAGRPGWRGYLRRCRGEELVQAYYPAMELLAHWWNGCWGSMSRCDIWLERLDDGLVQVRWRSREWTDRDGSWRTSESAKTLAAVRGLMETAPGKWQELPASRSGAPSTVDTPAKPEQSHGVQY